MTEDFGLIGIAVSVDITGPVPGDFDQERFERMVEEIREETVGKIAASLKVCSPLLAEAMVGDPIKVREDTDSALLPLKPPDGKLH